MTANAELGTHRERLAQALYDAWWQGIEDSRTSVGGKVRWPDVTTRNRQRFYGWADSMSPTTTSGAQLIAAERERQVEQEGWTPDHDDEHNDGMLSRAAICYADKAAVQARGNRDVGQLRPAWPWEARWWKPSDDPIRNLVKAGALLAAEIDRLQRALAPTDGSEAS